MLGMVASGIRAVANVAGGALKGSADIARQAVSTTTSAVISPVAQIIGASHMQMLNLPGMAGTVVQQVPSVPASAMSSSGHSGLGSLTVPPVSGKEGLGL